MQPAKLAAKTTRLQDKIARLREQMRNLTQIKEQLKTQPDGQLSMTDPVARSMATSGKGSGMVGDNLQVAADAKHHLIAAHEVTNCGSDRAQLGPIPKAARDAMGKTTPRAVADRGYYSGLQIKDCADAFLLMSFFLSVHCSLPHHRPDDSTGFQVPR